MRNGALHIAKNDSGHAAGPGAQEVRDAPVEREVMDIRQASSYLGISPDSLYRYASEGTIPGFRLGNRWRFRKTRLDTWMDEQSSLQETRQTRTRRRKPVRSAG